MTDRRWRDAVEAALDSSRREAGAARLPPALRARILAAVRPAPAPPPRGRVIDFVLRAAAVAAAIAAVLVVMPVSLEAAEFDASPLIELNARLADSVARHLSALDVAHAGLSVAPSGAAWPLAAAAAALVAAGLWLVRAER